MNEIGKLFLRCTQVILLATILVGGVFNSLRPDGKHYYYGSLIKSNLIKTVSPPRVIIFGGSNIALGIDSVLMEQQLGMPVINDGLDVHLGITPMLELKNHIQPGDIIIISLEYYLFTDETTLYGSPQFLADWVEMSPERILDLKDPLREMPSMFTIMLQRKVNRQVNFLLYGDSLDPFRGIYTGDKFNSQGDFIGHLDDENQTQVENPDATYPVNNLVEANIFLSDFNKFALAKGAKVFYEAQANRQTNCEITGIQDIRRFHRRLERNTGIPLLTNIDQLCLPDYLFYDTPYHLNAKGRELRTERLIENLKNALGLD